MSVVLEEGFSMADPQEASREFAALDIFTLLGVGNLPAEEKAKRLVEIEGIVLADFFATDVPELLSEAQRKKLETLQAGGGGVEEVLGRLREMIPDLSERLYRKTLAFKKDLVLGYLRFKLGVRDKEKELLDKGDYPGQALGLEEKVLELEKVEHRRGTLARVLELYEQGRWQEGAQLLNQG